MNALMVGGVIATSTVATTVVATSINAEPLLTALIGFGVSVVTMVGGEAIKFAVAWLKKKREDVEGKEDDKDVKTK